MGLKSKSRSRLSRRAQVAFRPLPERGHLDVQPDGRELGDGGGLPQTYAPLGIWTVARDRNPDTSPSFKDGYLLRSLTLKLLPISTSSSLRGGLPSSLQLY
jgi:hypothetical protein